MIKWLRKILVSLTVFTVLGHGMIAHQHPEDIAVISHHDDHVDDDHDTNQHQENNPFSFKFLDHLYTPPGSVFYSWDSEGIYFLLSENGYSVETPENILPWQFFIKNEHPPPVQFHYSLSLRGPPVSC